jgi:N-acetylglutamate synthase-like GNAT family acetyltransferase
VTTEYLADHPEALPILAEWQHREWGHLRPGDTVEKRTERLQGYSNRDRISLTVVALEAGNVLGSASLIPHDMDTRMELTPWLAGVFVGEAYRRLGIGAQLVRRIMAEAGKLKVPLLYLYTVHSEKFYAELGWTLQERTAYREQDVVIMNYAPAELKV